MSRFTKYRKKQRILAAERYERLVEGCEKLDEFNNKVQRLYHEHPDFILDPNDEKSIKIWNKYINEYHETLTDEFA